LFGGRFDARRGIGGRGSTLEAPSSEIAGRGEPEEGLRLCDEAGVERMVKMKDILRRDLKGSGDVEVVESIRA
jgi:hypothetical protein